MKEYAQNTKQLARTIQGSGRNQKVGFVDNRTIASIQLNKSSVIQRDPADDAMLNLVIYHRDWTNSVLKDCHESNFKTRVQQYLDQGGKFAGHKSGRRGDGMQGKTETDFQAFKTWYEKKYGTVGKRKR